jgi:hypothetical protein
MSASHHRSLQGLIELARRDGVEVRPALLRVLVDLYVQQPTHSPAEAARFAELASRLIERADLATRSAVAQRLATYPAVPPAVALKLARDEIAVAEPMLRHSNALGAAELHAVLDTAPVGHAIAIAARTVLPDSVAARIAGRAPQSDPAAPIPDQPIALRFLDADPSQRQQFFVTLERLGPPAGRNWHNMRSEIVEKLERAALARRPHEFAMHLERSLGIGSELAARIVSDSGGEPTLVVLRALGAPREVVERVLLFLNPEIGQSVRRIFALTKLYETLSEPVAHYLTNGWCRVGAQPHVRPKHAPEVALDASDRRDPRTAHRERSLPPLPVPRRARRSDRA